MSAHIYKDFECQCGNVMHLVLETSANFLNTEEVKDIISGKIMTRKCEKCGKEYFFDRVFLFNDIPGDKFIWYVPEVSIDKIPYNLASNVVYRDYGRFAEEVRKVMEGN